MSKSIKYYRNKADKKLQNVGREIYKECYVCGGEYSCLHHFITKGRSSRLRYDWDNLIPICHHCHSLHHSFGDAKIHAIIQKKKGNNWLNELLVKDRETVSVSIKFYKDTIKRLEICK